MITLKDFLIETYSEGIILRPRIICKDGFEISIQAGYTPYSEPAANLKNGNYKSVELGYLSSVEKNLIEYAEDKDCLLDTTYGFVPIEIVEKILLKHGGIIKY